jgi:hypothetical protein
MERLADLRPSEAPPEVANPSQDRLQFKKIVKWQISLVFVARRISDGQGGEQIGAASDYPDVSIS